MALFPADADMHTWQAENDLSHTVRTRFLKAFITQKYISQSRMSKHKDNFDNFVFWPISIFFKQFQEMNNEV